MSDAAFARILVGTDFSEGSGHALGLARSRFPGAALKLLHVLDARAMSMGVPDFSTGGLTPVMPGPDLVGAMGSADAARLQALAQPGEEHGVVSGDPARALIDAAQAWNADLIVVGTHSKGALEHFFVGSVAESVVRHSPLPVLTVRR